MKHFEKFTLALLLAGLAGTLHAESPDPSELLAQAREAWRAGDRAGREARQALLSKTAVSGERIDEWYRQEREGHERAEKLFLAALKLDRGHASGQRSPYLPEGYGRFLVARGRFAFAAEWIEGALLHPRAEDAFGFEERAELLRILGGLRERGAQPHRAIALYRRAIELDPGDARNVLSLAIAHCAQGDFDLALPLLEPLASHGWRGTLPGTGTMALALYTQAYALEQSGRLDDALTAYDRAHKLGEQAGAGDLSGVSEQARLAQRRIRRIVRQFEAEEAKRRKLAEEQKTDAPRAWREAFAQAHAYCDQGVKLKREALAILEALAAVQTDKAYLERTLLEHEAGWKEHGFLTAGHRVASAAFQSVFQAAGPARMQAAMAQFQEASTVFPQCGRAHRELGLAHLRALETKKAEPHLNAAALYDPLSPVILASQAEALMMLGDWEAAREAYADLAAVSPEYGPAYLGQARVAAKIETTARGLRGALDGLDRAERFGADTATVQTTRQTVTGLLARLERGERLEPAAGRQRPASARPAEIDPWKGGGTSPWEMLNP